MQKSGEQVLSTIQVLYSMLKKILAQSIHHTQPKGEKNSRPRKLPNLPLTPQKMMVSPLVSLSCCMLYYMCDSRRNPNDLNRDQAGNSGPRGRGNEVESQCF